MFEEHLNTLICLFLSRFSWFVHFVENLWHGVVLAIKPVKIKQSDEKPLSTTVFFCDVFNIDQALTDIRMI